MGSLWGLVFIFAGFGLYAGWFKALFPPAGCLGLLIPYVNYCVGLQSSTLAQINQFLSNVPIYWPIGLILVGLYLASAK